MRRLNFIPLFLGASLLIATHLAADPPARVARINLTEGTVSFHPATVDDWTPATINRPFVNGDELWTEPASRAELHIGSAAVRVGATTSFGIVAETDDIAQLRLTSGTLNVRVRHVGERETWEIDTPNASVSLLKPGRYRVDVTPDGLTTTVTSRGGEAEVTAGDAAFAVHTDEQGAVAGIADQTHEVSAAPPVDDFDRWCRDRDRREDRMASAHQLPREVVGYEDLEDSGTWRLTEGYGWAWTPTTVAAGWTPYHFGRWAWIEPWGWTWIDDAPWGFAPFHYGRWAFSGGAWLWVPGSIGRPVYAPALVAFGGGGGWRASISVGAVAWWPLAPREVFVPAYAVAPVYIRNINAPVVALTQVNVTNVDVTRIRYANQSVSGAVTVVSQESFVSAKPVAASAVTISTSQAASAKPIGMTAPVAPRVDDWTPATINRPFVNGDELWTEPASCGDFRFTASRRDRGRESVRCDINAIASWFQQRDRCVRRVDLPRFTFADVTNADIQRSACQAQLGDVVAPVVTAITAGLSVIGEMRLAWRTFKEDWATANATDGATRNRYWIAKYNQSAATMPGAIQIP